TELIGEAEPRLEVRVVARKERAVAPAGCRIYKAALQAEARNLQRESDGGSEIAEDIDAVGGRASLLPAQAKIERELAAYLIVILDKQRLILQRGGAGGVDAGGRAGRRAEQQGRHAVAGGGAGLARVGTLREPAVERVVTDRRVNAEHVSLIEP